MRAESLGVCLESLVAQSEVGFQLGREWELIVVDDGSTDGTRALAEAVPGVTVMTAPKLEEWFTGKDECLLGGGADGSWQGAAVYRCGHGARDGGPLARAAGDGRSIKRQCFLTRRGRWLRDCGKRC